MFLNALSSVDRERLRSVVRRVHLQYAPREFQSDYECDRVIEALGPEVAETLIRRGADEL